MQHFRSVNDVDNIQALLRKAMNAKAAPMKNSQLGKGKTIVLLFFNPSLRTRLSTQKAAQNLGMNVITMNAGQSWQLEFEDGAVMNLDRAEHVKEAARVISQYADILGIRTFPTLKDQERDYGEFVLNQFVKYATVPIVNLESATLHPLQSLTDWLTIVEQKKTAAPKVVLTWAPHPRPLPQAVANSLVEWLKKTDVELVITHPQGYELAPTFAEGCQIEFDQKKAFAGADFIYAKNWSSYFNYGNKPEVELDWRITSEKMALTNSAKFMHCLPVRRNVVVEDAVIDSPNSLVIQQAANREFAAQAVLESLLKNENL
ncbi:MAG: N-acetylornithine carbamoyltransferase [Bacteroidota bacterium]